MELGTIAEISFKDSCKMDKAVLYFNIKNSFIDNELGTYSENNDELSGIKRLGIFTFNEEYNIIVPVVTEYDTESNTVYAEVDAQGTYFLVDYEKWLNEWGISAGLDTMAVRFMSAAASVNSEDVSNEKIEKADIVFSVDVSAYSRNNLGETPAQNLERAKNDIRTVAENIFTKGEDIRFGAFGFTWKYSSNEIGYRTYLEDGSDWATDLDELDYLLDQLYIDNNYGGAYIECGIQDAASPIITRVKQYEYRDDADKYLFEYAPLSDLYIYSDGYLAATLCSYSALYDQLKRSGIRFSFVLDKLSYLVITETAAMQTGGQTAFYCLDTVTDDISDFIYETANKVKNAVEEDDNDEVKLRTYVSSLNLQNIVLDEPLKLSTRDDACNTDKDGLTDCQEVDSAKGLMTYAPDMKPILPTYEQCIECADLNEDAKEIMLELKNKLGEYGYSQVRNMTVLPLISDPTCEDTDGDGVNDDIDDSPLNKSYIINLGSERYKLDLESRVMSKYGAYINQFNFDNNTEKFFYDFYNDFKNHFESKEKRKARYYVKEMMHDVLYSNYRKDMPLKEWYIFCSYFNHYVEILGEIDETLHYFRNNLNRAPATLNEMISEINSCENIYDKWSMCSPQKGRFHMYGEFGAYNIKFISSDSTGNLFEAVYDINGNLITESDDFGKNMGTYNYASSSESSNFHNKVDVGTYEKWGNTILDNKPIKDSWDANVIGEYDSSYSADKNDPDNEAVDAGALNHYYDICHKIGIDYADLQKKHFSNKCYS